jgi:glycosyltransferase involved in cell wall biosynthesis
VKTKVLILSDYAFTKGGAERVAISSAVGLSKKGYEVVFFSAVGPIDDELLKAGLKDVICLDQKDILDNPHRFIAMISGIYNWRATGALKKLFSVWIPDIVHVHGVSKALSWAPINTIYSYKIPIIYTLHDYGLVCPNLGIYDFRAGAVCEHYKPGHKLRCLTVNCDKRSYLQKLWRWIRFSIVKNIFKVNKKVSGYVAVSRFIAELAGKYLAGKKPVRIIYNPIEIDQMQKVKCRVTDKKRTEFLYVGRLSAEKGIDLLLDAISEVDAGLTIIGDGELMDMCRDYASRLGNKKIKILGYRDKKEVFTKMRNSSALILPSRCMEPAPLVLAEASYNCLPSIVADHGGLVEFIKDRVNGLHFKAGSKESLIDSMKKFIKNLALSGRMGKKAREIICKKDLSIDCYIDKIGKYYIDILRSK